MCDNTTEEDLFEEYRIYTWCHFLNRKTLLEDCPEYFNAETGLLEAPLVIRVADQVRRASRKFLSPLLKHAANFLLDKSDSF